MKNRNSQVPSYGLYGEALISSDPGLVHIEDISVRSSEFGWVIKAHRHSNLFQILCIFDGDAEVSLNGKSHTLNGNCLVTIPSGVVHGFRFDPKVNGFVLSIDESILFTAHTAAQQGMKPPVYQPQVVDASPGDNDYQAFLSSIETLKEEFNQHRPDSNQAMNALAQLALISLNRHMKTKQISSALDGDESRILGKFKELLENHYREQWPVAKYAENLHVSTSTLSRLCHHYAGENPKAIVQQRLIAEAKRRLMYTRQSIEDIAYTLGFKDQAYFSRFFKKLQGQSPAAYRKSEYQ